MRFQPGSSRDEFLAELRQRSERTWGVQRTADLGPALEAAANSLWRLAQVPLELLDDEPDFVGGVAPRNGA